MAAPIASWLRDTRLRQRRADGEPWTQDDLLTRMQAEIGWAPHRPNYSKYETGRATPEAPTLAKFVDFWARHKEPGPDLSDPAPVVVIDPLAAAISELVVELRAAREERQTMAVRLDEMERLVTRLAEREFAADPTPVAPHETAGSGR